MIVERFLGMQVALTEAVDMVFEMADGREMVLTL